MGPTRRSAPKPASSTDDGVTGLLHLLRDGVAVLDPVDRRVLDANAALTAMLGYTCAELCELPSLLALAVSRDGAMAGTDRVYELARVARRFEIALLHKEGQKVEIEATVSELEDGCLLAIVRDVTARKRAEAALLQVSDALEQSIREHAEALSRVNGALGEAVRARDEFIQIASHELRTPLTPLLLQLQMLRRKASAATDAAQVHALVGGLDATLRHVKRLTRLVDQLLDVSSLRSASEIPLEATTFDLTALARDVVGRAELDASSIGCSVTLDAPEAAIEMRGDASRVEDALTNLVANAVKFGAGKPVDVTLEERGDVARIVVRDRGIGVLAEDRERIFDRFERAVSSENYGGFGLGLWIARQAVRVHGGTITVESEPGQGAAFTIEIPRG